MDFQKHALILAMIEALQRQGSRTGKTHIIKGFFLGDAADLLKVPFEFFLYKHGPYSTDIEETIEQMKSYGAAEVKPAFDGYGVILSPGPMASFATQRMALPANTLEAIDRVCDFLRYKNVNQLERLATAAWIRVRQAIHDPDEVAHRLNELKPHVSLSEARQADEEVLTFLEACKSGSCVRNGCPYCGKCGQLQGTGAGGPCPPPSHIDESCSAQAVAERQTDGIDVYGHVTIGGEVRGAEPSTSFAKHLIGSLDSMIEIVGEGKRLAEDERARLTRSLSCLAGLLRKGEPPAHEWGAVPHLNVALASLKQGEPPLAGEIRRVCQEIATIEGVWRRERFKGDDLDNLPPPETAVEAEPNPFAAGKDRGW